MEMPWRRPNQKPRNPVEKACGICQGKNVAWDVVNHLLAHSEFQRFIENSNRYPGWQYHVRLLVCDGLHDKSVVGLNFSCTAG